MDKPGVRHWTAARNVLRYLKGTMSHVIVYKAISGSDLVGYSDADFASDVETRKSTCGYAFIVSGEVISWRRKNQTLTAQSIVESELIALSIAIRELITLQKLLFDARVSVTTGHTIHVDNQGCIALCKSGAFTDLTIPTGVKLSFIMDYISNVQIKLVYVPANQMASDIFTKKLLRNKQLNKLQALGIKHFVPSSRGSVAG